ncbi:transcriptional regulator [Virgibacillus profundi]|uniref:Transcriptional regulator n=1 Tax=Virgibacillus profundi TaxID=2024555 RepID=A0A2A2I917_9BACI|nr:PLDc N-terminal domain-containing protein [Virgibacillus profundi]PAV28127.1 transcriptional regulator [Virgibacillus profundi]PXY52432.1 transcriptional regulator [Virgibacillus profundi]
MQEFFDAINWAVIAPVLVIQGILIIIAMIDWAKADNTNGPKWMWFFIIIFVNIFGPILYFIFGRSQR